jgi:uncharacterized protein YbaA (DUF1428 family)
VKAERDEIVVFSWLEYPSREARDAANKKITSDPRMKELGAAMPFDGTRMIYGGFTTMRDDGGAFEMGYVDGSLVPVPVANKAAYSDIAAKQAAVLREHGATRVVNAWGDDIPDGKITDYRGAVKAKSEETVVYTWVEWPSKDVRDAGWRKVFVDARMRLDNLPYDHTRRVHGGFAPVLEA